jgi:hypothetical protein
MIVNTDYEMAAATVTDTSLSRIEQPLGFPASLVWSPAIGGFSSSPVGGIYTWRTAGRWITVTVRNPNVGTSNGATMTFSAPVNAATITNMIWIAEATVTDNGTLALGRIEIASAGGSLLLGASFLATGGFTTSGDKRCSFASLTYRF